MNRKAALFISVILLTQVASYSLNQITPQIDREEPLQGDSTREVSGRNSTDGNNTGGNNTGGNNTWDIPVITHIDSNTGWPYYEGDVFEILTGESFEWDVSMTNLTVGEEYRLTVTIENQNGTDSVSLGDKIFNATGNTATVMSEEDSYQYPQGCYWANVEVVMLPESLGISDNFNFVIDVDYSNCSPIGNNNTGGNNTGGNNTGGNNSGTVNNTLNECLMFNNVSYDYNYSAAPQDSFNITADLFNYCADWINYPSTLILNDTQGINVSSDDVNWRYAIDGNSSYPVSWLVTRDTTVVEGTIVTFELHPTIDNCSVNCTESQNYSYIMTIPFGLVDLNTCYKLDNVSDDYLPGEMSFNLSASLNNTCWGDIHYPSGVLYDGDGTTSSPAEGAQNPGAMAYMIYENTSTMVNWQILIDENISNGMANYSLQPACSVYNFPISVGSYPSYMQDCSDSTLDMVNYSVMIGIPNNQTVNETGNNTDGNNSSDCLGDTSTGVLTYLTMALNSDYADGDNLFTMKFMINCATLGQEYFMDFTISSESGNMNPIDNITTYSWIANRTFSSDEFSATWDLPLGTDYCLTAELYHGDGEWISNDEWCPFDVTNYTDSDDNNTGGNTSQSNDTDMDGFDDIVDNCPNVFSFNQNDIDNDGIGDVCDSDTEMDECVFADIDFEENSEVIFYLSWVDANGNQHCGTLQFELYSDAAPIHSQNFRDHAAAGNYDGVIFHRIIDTFMIQSGDIQNGDGTGGYAYSWHGYCNGQQISEDDCPSENYYSIPDEFSPDHLHQYGALSMAHAGPNTGGSQFFIMDSESATWLDQVHSVFGQAIAGTIDGQSVAADSVVNAISQVETTGSSPTFDVTIISADVIFSLDEVEDDDDDDGALPGFTSLISISALLGAAIVRFRKE